MTMAGPRTLRAFCNVLNYPVDETLESCELLYIILQSELPEAAHEMAQFGSWLEQHPIWELEEVYTATFDVNPACALEIGWHLFGEEYDRGLLLVRLREEMRKYDLAESSELPDHLTHVLPLISAMPEDEAHRFVTACVQPAVQKMQSTLSRGDSPYRLVFNALALVMQSVWGEGRKLCDGSGPQRDDGRVIPDGVDLLHAFPAADVPMGCGSCSCGGDGHQHSVPLVQLEVVDSKLEDLP